MPELHQKVVPYEYNYLCDACEGGMMQATGEKTEKGYTHKCMICSSEAHLAKSYPHIEYFPLDACPD